MARAKLDIDPKEVETLASYGCTATEIAAFFNCNETTIRKRFSENLTKGKESGKIRLRQKQFKVAMAGNVAMLIWLGKQTLGQTDKQGIEHSGTIDSKLTIEVIKIKGKDEDNGK